MKARFNKFLTLLAVLLFGFGQIWATDVFTASPNSSLSSAVTQGSAPVASPVALTSSQVTVSGGTMYMVNTESNTRTFISTSEGPSGDKRKCFKIEANKQFFKVILTSALQAGDVISADLYKNNIALWFTTATSKPSSAPTAKLEVGSTATSSTWAPSKTYTVATSDGICGETTFYIYRNSNTTCFTNFSITRSGTPADSYTVNYKDDEDNDLGSETVEVGSKPTATSINKNKDFYTFEAWQLSGVDKALTDDSWTSVAKDATVTLTARYSGPNYFTTSVDFEDDGATKVANIASYNIIASNAGSYDGGKESENWAYKGWKIKSNGATVKVFVQAGKKLTFKFGYLDATGHVTITNDATNYSVTGASKTQDDPLKFTTYSWIKAYDAVYTFTTGNSSAAVIKALTIQDTYTATRVDAKSDGAGTDANVTETTLPTPTAISGWTFTGWTANENVKLAEETKTAGTLLAAGTYTLLANTTFTAQWAEASATYDITYVSARGTAPAAENAASVVLAEITGVEGWAHKGWTANVDVTVDAATVTAGTLIANGKTAILASDITFTAVWKQVFTLTFDSKDGSAVAPQYIEDGGNPTAVEAPTKDNYVFLGWSETEDGAVVADITALTIEGNKTLYAQWALDVQVTEIVFSNGFKAWINGSAITVFYMEGESAPTITSYAGKNLKAEGGVVISGDKIIATGTDESVKQFDLTMTAVAPLTATGAQTFDGTEGYVKTPHAWTAERKWKMSKYATDGRVARGECSLYFFVGPAESVTFEWGAQKVTEDVAVYVNGTFVKNIGKNNNTAIELSKDNSMVAFYTLQTSGDIWLNGLTVVPYVPTTAVVLKEESTAISEKEIWAGTNFTLTAEVTPDNASDKTITWTSSNEAVATVVGGVVTGVAANASPVTITATTVDGITATCAVTVTAAPTPSADPIITAQPASANYYEEATIAALEVVATGESLTYQWYLGSDPIDGATNATYTPTVTAIGTYVYHCVVTNTEAGHLPTSLASNNATITISEDPAAIKLLDGSTVNHTNFITGVTASTVEIESVEYNCVAFAGTVSGVNAVKDLTRVVAYNATTTQTKVQLKLYNSNGNSRTIEVKGVVEGSTDVVNLASITLTGNEQKTTEWIEFNNATNRTIYIYVSSNAGHIKILQTKVIESGTALKMAGEAGYSLNFNQGRFFGVKDVTAHFEELDVEVASSDCQPLNTSVVKLANSSISFEVVNPVTLTVTTNNNKTYYVTKGSAGTDNETAKTGATEFSLTAGTWYITGGSSNVEITNIAFSAPKCAEPAFNALVNSELCAGDPFEALDGTATVADAALTGSISYQWYKSDNTLIAGEESATFTPSEDGGYYVIAINHRDGFSDNEKKSDVVTVATHAGTVINEAPVNQRAAKDETATLTVDASGKNVTYVWYTCDNEAGENPVAITPAETSASLTITVTEGLNQWYKVVVHSDCGADQSATAKIEQFVPVSQADVTGSIVWDWTEAASVAQIKLTDATTPKKNEGFVMANGAATIYNNANFESDKLYLEGEYIIRDSKFFQGQTVKFNTTVAGVVSVKFSNTGGNPARELYINGVGTGVSSASATAVQTGYVEVPAGEVSITAYLVDKSADPEQKYVRISKIEFFALDVTRNDSWIAPGELGTVCYPNGHVVIGAEMYEMAGTNEVGKFVFDEVEVLTPGKPYLFKATSNNPIKFYKTTAAPAAEAGTSNGMVGTFDEIIIPRTTPNTYYFSGTKFYAVTARATDLTVPANRAYVDLTTPHPALAPKPGARRITFDVQGENAAQGFENIEAGDAPLKIMIDGTLYILRGEKVYNANGQLVK